MNIDRIQATIRKGDEKLPFLYIGSFDRWSSFVPEPDFEWEFKHGDLGVALLVLGYVHYFIVVEKVEAPICGISEKVTRKLCENSENIGALLKKWFAFEGFLNEKFPFFMEEGWYDKFEEVEDESLKGVHYCNDKLGLQIVFDRQTYIREHPLLMKEEYYDELVNDLLTIETILFGRGQIKTV